ncbi:hypothetical protein HCJ93_23570 [Streptomyces sp. SBST2-5]|uniref:Uncharacterized protein n=1 Tax=Streptomyces composti TaxID=2720025 RepID=A0ABX1AGJ0_9ACTN|nr:DUF6397 family protein [Streptomyces composti]NJP52964.1 hypothetical protein [Streptomyces composti]
MSGSTFTSVTSVTAVTSVPSPVAAERRSPGRDPWLEPSRAARELGLERHEFDLAVRLGRIRTRPVGGGDGGRAVARTEIARLRARPGFPEALRACVETVGTARGAALMKVTEDRFTRLARLGLLVPVRFTLGPHGAVDWLYLAEELRAFAAAEENAELLTGRPSGALGTPLDPDLDVRPRNWRNRHLGCLLRLADGDPWGRAGAVASLLDPLQVAEVVKDPYERSRLNAHRAAPPAGGASGPSAVRLARELTTAQDEDETAWLRAELTGLVAQAREHRPAPGPTPRSSRAVCTGTPERDRPLGGLRALLGRRWCRSRRPIGDR